MGLATISGVHPKILLTQSSLQTEYGNGEKETNRQQGRAGDRKVKRKRKKNTVSACRMKRTHSLVEGV